MNRNHQVRRCAGLLVLAGLLALIGAAMAARPGIDYFYGYEDRYRAGQFVRHPPDSNSGSPCKQASDTLTGPSVYCLGARKVIWRIKANSGTCSTLTAQVSRNDTTWLNAASPQLAVVMSDFNLNDSLNAGGKVVTILPRDTLGYGQAGIAYAYSRVFVRRKSGGVSLCNSRLDSLRWAAAVLWTDP